MRCAVLALVLAACGTVEAPKPVDPPKPAEPANAFDPVIHDLDGIRHRMCTCTNDSCATKVGDEHRAWMRTHKRLATGGDDAASDAQVGRALRLELAYAKCRKRFSGAAQAMAKMEEFKDMMCACADKACADKVTDEMTKWSQEMAKDADRDARVSEEDTKRMQVIVEQFTECATKAMTAGMGP